VSYADSRFSGKAGFGCRFSFGKDRRAYYAGSFGRIEDSWVEEASLVLYSISDREGFSGLDHTLGGQSAQRAIDGDVGADSGEAGDGTGDRYGTSPNARKDISYESQ